MSRFLAGLLMGLLLPGLAWAGSLDHGYGTAVYPGATAASGDQFDIGSYTFYESGDVLSLHNATSHLWQFAGGTLLLPTYSAGILTVTSNSQVQSGSTLPGGLTFAGALTAQGNPTIQKADPSMIFDPLTFGDTDYWLGVDQDDTGDDDDHFQIGTGTTPLSQEWFTYRDNSSPTGGLILKQATSNPMSLNIANPNVAHGVTTIVPDTTVFGRLVNLSSTDGGLQITGLSDNGATPSLILRPVQVANPTDTTPAMQIRAAVASGTGIADIAAAETAFQVSDSTGADDYLTVDGAGNTLVTGTVTSSGNDLGWSIVDQTDNQACTTGCTSACVFGIENATGAAITGVVSCAATTSDLCACAGGS